MTRTNQTQKEHPVTFGGVAIPQPNSPPERHAEDEQAGPSVKRRGRKPSSPPAVPATSGGKVTKARGKKQTAKELAIVLFEPGLGPSSPVNPVPAIAPEVVRPSIIPSQVIDLDDGTDDVALTQPSKLFITRSYRTSKRTGRLQKCKLKVEFVKANRKFIEGDLLELKIKKSALITPRAGVVEGIEPNNEERYIGGSNLGMVSDVVCNSEGWIVLDNRVKHKAIYESIILELATQVGLLQQENEGLVDARSVMCKVHYRKVTTQIKKLHDLVN